MSAGRAPWPLSPLGTLRSAWSSRSGARVEVDDAELPAELALRVQRQELGEAEAFLAWEIGSWGDDTAPLSRRARVALAAALWVAQRRGSTCLPLQGGGLADVLGELGMQDVWPAVRAWLDTLARAEMEGARGVDAARVDAALPFLVHAGAVYLPRGFQQEAMLLEHLTRRIGAPPPVAVAQVEAAVEDVVARPPRVGGRLLAPGARQEEALRKALRSGLCAITGGPGTGKTSIVVSVLRAWLRLGGRPDAIALAAPTGKAAHRLGAAVGSTLAAIGEPAPVDLALADAGLRATTLHRLLGYSPRTGRFRHGSHAPLPHDLIVVDEASMVPLGLAEPLLGALRPEAQLVLLGDADQLPSVEAGSVFRDLVPAPDDTDDPRAAFGVRLDQSYRMDERDPAGRHILEVAQAVRRGRLIAASDTLRPTPANLTFTGVEQLPGGQAQRQAFLDTWFARRLAWLESLRDATTRSYAFPAAGADDEATTCLRQLLAASEASLLLTVTRGAGHPTGAEALNAQLHARYWRRWGAEAAQSAWLPGEPVVVHNNDYARGLFNGDRGVVVRLDGPGKRRLGVVFDRPDGLCAYPLDAIAPILTLGFATTVHKAQGSEADHVALVLPDQIQPWNAALCTREVLYTAITRSRRSVVIVGEGDVLAHAVDHPLVRHSGLAARLVRALSA